MECDQHINVQQSNLTNGYPQFALEMFRFTQTDINESHLRIAVTV